MDAGHPASAAEAAREAQAPALPSGTVTFLFTDIEGSTKLLHELGADRYSKALAEHRRILREAFTAHGGVEVDTQGDAFFVAFPTAPGALAAARQATTALATGPIHVRIGLHTGEASLSAKTYVGLHVHRASRIAGVGHGGQVQRLSPPEPSAASIAAITRSVNAPSALMNACTALGIALLDGKVDKDVGTAGTVLSSGKTLTFTGRRSIEVRTGSSGVTPCASFASRERASSRTASSCWSRCGCRSRCSC